MTEKLDELDRKILRMLQVDASQSVEALADKVGLSRNACWRRMRLLEEAGVIRGKVALVDADAVDVGLSALVLIRTSEHDDTWLEQFRKAVDAMPEVTNAYRMSGDLDYVLRVRVASVRAYDDFYKRFVRKIRAHDISASFVMEEIKETTALPV